MNFIKQLINTYRKGEQYNNLYDNYLRLSNEYDFLTDEYEETSKQLEKLREELSSLNQTLDINSLKDWYEGRREPSTWFYNGQRLGKKDVKVYLTPSDDKPFKKLADELITKYKLSKDNNPTEIISAMYKYWNLSGSWTYKYDKDLYGSVEWWEDPLTAFTKRKGDCESKAMVMYNTAYWMLKKLGKGDSVWRLTFVCSMVLGEGGHGYLTWLYNDGEYYVIESTYDNVRSKNKTWLKTPIRYNNLYHSFWGFATLERSWKGSNSAFMSFTEHHL
jgi:hypothetical protein